MRIAVDVGFGYVKCVGEDGRRAVFPSVVAPAPAAAGVLAQAMGKRAEVGYRLQAWPQGRPDQAREYLVGEAALAARGGSRAWEREAADNQHLHVLVAAACALVSHGGGVELAAGLPLGHYAGQRESLGAALGGMDVVVVVNEGAPVRVRVDDVFVFPQGAGCYSAACLHPDGTVRDRVLIRQPVGVIDVGYRTTDYLVMQMGPGGLTPRDDLAGSLDLGMNQALQETAADLEARAGQPVDVVQVERALSWADGRLYVRGREYDAGTLHEEALRRLAERVAGRIKLAWGDEAEHLAAVLVAGGGGEALYPYLAAHFPAARLAEDAIYANAQGYLAAQALRRRMAARA